MLNVQRLTISLPSYLHQLLVNRVDSGKMSQFVTGILEKELIAKKTANSVDDFFSLRKSLQKKTYGEIKKAIKKGRT